MKKINTAILVLATASSLLVAENRYGEKSGIIEYEITGSGKVMGVDTKITGSSIQYFKDYGNTFLAKEQTSQTTMGTTQVEKETYKFENDIFYSVDFEKKLIMKHKITGKLKEMDLMVVSENNLKKYGGKKEGSEKIAGYTCDNWVLKDEKLCVYEGIVLKSTSTQMGLTHTQKAKSVKFISVSEDNFKLPPYPEKTTADMMKDMQKQLAKEMENATPEQKKMMQEMMKKMMENPTGAISSQ